MLIRRAVTPLRRLYSTKPIPVKVDSLCIPISPPYSISSFIPSPTPLSRERLIKLHKLAALNSPSSEFEWEKLKSLDGLVAIVDSIREVDTSSVGEVVDARVRAEEKPIEFNTIGTKEKKEEGMGRELLELAKVREGAYYVVRTPEGIRGKKRGGGTGAQPLDEP